ncbi:MAG: tyrosine-type recombinase/integrase [Pseudomonadota bacterium]
MVKHNADNERIKHRYQLYREGACGQNAASVDKALAAIHDFEQSTGFKPFRLFHINQAMAYVRTLGDRINPKTGKPYALATINANLAALRTFFIWFGGQSEGRYRINYGDADYFRLSEKDGRIARATRPKRVPSLDEARQVVLAMPFGTDIKKRDRALMAFLLLTGARVDAIRSARLKHVNMETGHFHQDARDVRTKRSKTFVTGFSPVGDDMAAILADWVSHLTGVLAFGPDDPLFPRTALTHDDHACFAPGGLARDPWQSTGTIRTIVAEAFKAQGLPPANPHILRDTLAQLGQRLCRTPEEMKAWSQNLGHDRVLTTLTSYGTVPPEQQTAIIQGLANRDEDADPLGDLTRAETETVLRFMKQVLLKLPEVT